MLVLCLACGKATPSIQTPPNFQLPTNSYTINKVYDIGNSGNSSDLRVQLTVLPTIPVADFIEVRLIITKATKSFSADEIAGLASGNFFSIPISNTALQVIKPSSVKDSDGDDLTNGIAYNIYVGIIGKEDAKQLSGAKNFILADKPIYAGDYVGTWEDLGPPGPGTFPVTLRVAENYSAQMFYTPNFAPYGHGPGLQDVSATLEITGSTFSFDANQFIDKYIGGGAFTTGGSGGCPATKVLTGVIQDDINLVFDIFNWSDCDGTRNVQLKFTRQ